MDVMQVIRSVKKPDQAVAQRVRARWASVAKPLGSLGVLEEDLVTIGAAQGSERIKLEKKGIVVFCADNGIVAESVTQTSQDVTASVARHMGAGTSCVCRMAACANVQVIPVDIGIAADMDGSGLLQKKVAWGTKNFLKEDAMSRDEVLRAMQVGMELAYSLKDEGFSILGSGEMGIGNTTTSAAVLCALLGMDPGEAAGRGAGLSSAGLSRKAEVIREGLRLRSPDPTDGIDVLAKVGGLDLAGLCGLYIGCAAVGIPAVLDGVISAAAAVAAVAICPAVREYLIASHISAEPAGRAALKHLGLSAAIDAGMRLGEGTGAAAFFPMLDMAFAIYRDMSTFEEMEVKRYQPLV